MLSPSPHMPRTSTGFGSEHPMKDHQRKRAADAEDGGDDQVHDLKDYWPLVHHAARRSHSMSCSSTTGARSPHAVPGEAFSSDILRSRSDGMMVTSSACCLS